MKSHIFKLNTLLQGAEIIKNLKLMYAKAKLLQKRKNNSIRVLSGLSSKLGQACRETLGLLDAFQEKSKMGFATFDAEETVIYGDSENGISHDGTST